MGGCTRSALSRLSAFHFWSSIGESMGQIRAKATSTVGPGSLERLQTSMCQVSANEGGPSNGTYQRADSTTTLHHLIMKGSIAPGVHVVRPGRGHVHRIGVIFGDSTSSNENCPRMLSTSSAIGGVSLILQVIDIVDFHRPREIFFEKSRHVEQVSANTIQRTVLTRPLGGLPAAFSSSVVCGLHASSNAAIPQRLVESRLVSNHSFRLDHSLQRL